jgi:hypothetical protein
VIKDGLKEEDEEFVARSCLGVGTGTIGALRETGFAGLPVSK